LQQSLKDLERAYKNFFAKRANLPHFKKKGQSESFRYPQGCKLDQPTSRIDECTDTTSHSVIPGLGDHRNGVQDGLKESRVPNRIDGVDHVHCAG